MCLLALNGISAQVSCAEHRVEPTRARLAFLLVTVHSSLAIHTSVRHLFAPLYIAKHRRNPCQFSPHVCAALDPSVSIAAVDHLTAFQEQAWSAQLQRPAVPCPSSQHTPVD